MDSINNANCQVGTNGSRTMSQNGANMSNGQNVNGQNNANVDVRHTYTIPGIVQYLQYEWQRFELHRQQWEVERSELQARIALLQGERKGQESLKSDLIRRIKMLEYCLRQERVKFHKLKYGVDPPNQENDLSDELNEFNLELEDNMNTDGPNGVNWKQGRQLLRHYLQEIGYTDTIIDVRSNRVRSLLGLSNLNEELTSEQIANKFIAQSQYQKSKKKLEMMNPSNMMVNDAESSVLATFEFLNNQSDNGIMENIEGEDEDAIDNNEVGSIGNDETEEVMNEFDMILNNRMDMNEHDIANWKPNVTKDVDIGELASLTETNNVIDCNTTLSTEVRKTWSQKYILKSHYDCIRALRFHASEPLLITASEDETLKLWNLNKTQPTKSKQQVNPVNATLDLEPIYTYRGHTSRILSLCMNGNMFYSGSQDGQIIVWSIPANINTIDPYDPYDSKLQLNNIMAHQNAIWSLASLTSSTSNSQVLCSASSDGTIKIWDTTRSVCVKTLEHEEDTIPTDLFVIESPNLNTNISSSPMLITSFNDGSIALYDIEGSSTPVLSFEKLIQETQVPCSISSLAVHPTLPIVISAHQDRHIRLWDINSGKCIHSMVAHLDEVTSVDCDPNGLYLLSGSHDCSVRLWNFDNKNCVQEITSHRKKFGEAIFDVTFHPSKPYFASAGADALAKVFV
ncbi:hypothetical protein RDWZM_000705 [Blomia tropicalis]|uniref:Striatin N-terminal domain-containing protein n=1 Tax=Blomia tropicalis TaxID=40697 RepID=A0A9Q0RQ17_BLOTA|nr:hypothetical protein RDWZM_000705 [Blomia tropicalis]